MSWAASVSFSPADRAKSFPTATVADLPPNGIVVVAVGPRPYTGGEDFRALRFPLRFSDGYFVSNQYEGQPAPHVAVLLLDGWVGDELLNVTVWLGSTDPPPELRAELDRALAALRVGDGVETRFELD